MAGHFRQVTPAATVNYSIGDELLSFTGDTVIAGRGRGGSDEPDIFLSNADTSVSRVQFIIFHLGPELDNQIAIVDSWSFMGTKTVERSNEKREKEFSRKGHRKVLTFDPDECFTLEMGQMNTR